MERTRRGMEAGSRSSVNGPDFLDFMGGEKNPEKAKQKATKEREAIGGEGRAPPTEQVLAMTYGKRQRAFSRFSSGHRSQPSVEMERENARFFCLSDSAEWKCDVTHGVASREIRRLYVRSEEK